MTIDAALKKYSVGTELFVIKEMVIRWNTMRFDNSNVVCGKYVVIELDNSSLWGSNKVSILKAVDLPKGTKNYPKNLHSFLKEFHCFTSKTDAEVWKILELQDLEQKVNNHITLLKEKTLKKIKNIKQNKKFDNYIEKYPEVFLRIV